MTLAFWFCLGLGFAIVLTWLSVWAFAFVMVYGAIILERVSSWYEMSNCLFFAVRKFMEARRDPDKHQVALVVQWSSRYWGVHLWFARRVQAQWVEEYIPKLRRRLVPPTMIFRGRVRRKRSPDKGA